MSKGVLIRLVLSVVVTCCAASATEIDPAAAVAILQQRVDSRGLAGVSAAISHNGQIAWEGGAGFRDLEAKLPADAEMVHRIASITKSMTAVAVMQLVEQGKVDLDAELQTYVPEFPRKEEGAITIHHLLTHTSGIRHYRGKENRPFENYPTLDDAMKLFWERPLAAPPGEKFVYTTYGYTTLGAVIERASGQKYAEYMKDHVWSPAGMTHTSLEIPGESGPNRSKLYRKNRDGKIEPDDVTNLSVKYPGGGVVSTAGDLVRFANAFETGKLVSAATRDRMFVVPAVEDRRLPYALGWMVWDSDTYGKCFANDGGQAGTSTFLVVLQDYGIAVAVIGNVARVGGDVSAIAYELADLLIEE